MAAGIPVIASDFPLWRNIIQGADCGILVNPLDAGSIAEAIQRLITNPSEAEAMGRRGRGAIEKSFNWKNEEQTLLSFYSGLLPERVVVQGARDFSDVPYAKVRPGWRSWRRRGGVGP